MTFLSKIFFFTAYVDNNNKSSFPKPLNADDEREALRLLREGDPQQQAAARDRLIRHNLRLVAHVTKKFVNAAEADDLISVGSIGLIKAINTFEARHKTQLATYAARCIENEILMYIRANKKHKPNKSFFDPIGTDREGNKIELVDILSSKEDNVTEEVENAMIISDMLAVVKKVLDEREYIIIKLRYGLEGQQEPLPQREVAQQLGISRSYISRIEKKSIEKVREEIKRRDSDDY